jgi:hypothetical protein
MEAGEVVLHPPIHSTGNARFGGLANAKAQASAHEGGNLGSFEWIGRKLKACATDTRLRRYAKRYRANNAAKPTPSTARHRHQHRLVDDASYTAPPATGGQQNPASIAHGTTG